MVMGSTSGVSTGEFIMVTTGLRDSEGDAREIGGETRS
jgi:hypothetical protein